MGYYEQNLRVGQRFWVNDRACELVGKDYAPLPERTGSYSHYDIMSRYSRDYEFTVRWDDDQSTEKYSEYGIGILLDNKTYEPDSEYTVGDTLEVRREGLDPNLRGRLVEINPKAERWPYRVQSEDGMSSAWFGYSELTKIHSVVSRERAPKAVEALQKVIAEKRGELEALETALEVLQYASN